MIISVWKRAGLSVGCCFLLIAVLSGLLGPHGDMDIVLRIALTFVLPLWLVFLPLAIMVKDARGSHFLVILSWGVLAGPLVLLVFFFAQILQGANPRMVWQGDPTVPSTPVWLALASMCSVLVSVLYCISLKGCCHFAQRQSVGGK